MRHDKKKKTDAMNGLYHELNNVTDLRRSALRRARAAIDEDLRPLEAQLGANIERAHLAGNSYKDIAAYMNTSYMTVKKHVDIYRTAKATDEAYEFIFGGK